MLAKKCKIQPDKKTGRLRRFFKTPSNWKNQLQKKYYNLSSIINAWWQQIFSQCGSFVRSLFYGGMKEREREERRESDGGLGMLAKSLEGWERGARCNYARTKWPFTKIGPRQIKPNFYFTQSVEYRPYSIYLQCTVGIPWLELLLSHVYKRWHYFQRFNWDLFNKKVSSITKLLGTVHSFCTRKLCTISMRWKCKMVCLNLKRKALPRRRRRRRQRKLYGKEEWGSALWRFPLG